MLMDYQRLGERIQSQRTRKGMTQAQLGDATGYTSSHIGQLENARTTPSLEAVVRIANALEVTPDQLLFDSLDHPEIVYMNKIEKRLNSLALRPRITACEMLERMMDLIQQAGES